MNIKKIFAILILGIVLAGCGESVPPEKSAYVGEWESPVMYLLITQAGKIDYKRQNGNTSTSVSGPLQKFEGNNFHVGFGPISTTFVVSKPPYQVNDGWKMVVDGVELAKKTR